MNASLPPLRVTGCANFRDLADQIHPRIALRPRTLFRSSHLGELDAADVRQIQSLGIRRVIDFRGERERLHALCALPDVAVHPLSIEPAVLQVLRNLKDAGQRLSAQDMAVLMQDTYRGFVRDNTARFAQFFELLLAASDPLVFHCTAGKDRTGFAAALVLHALGATHEDIMRDYLQTNQCLPPRPVVPGGLAPEVVKVMWGVQADFLEAAFEAVRQDHGSLDAYLRDALSLSADCLKELRRMYLQP